MGFGKSFGNKAGKNTANALFNMLGIDFSDRRRISIDRGESRRIKAEADAEIARQNELNLIDQAVLENVDMVVGIHFSNDPENLCNEINDLIVQLEVNKWGSITDDEAKVRNKYTDAVLSKIKGGIRQLERIDPLNPEIDFFKSVIRKARRRKLFGKFWVLLIVLIFILTFILLAIAEENDWYLEDVVTALIIIISLYVALKISLAIIRYNKKKKRLEAYQQKNTGISQNVETKPIQKQTNVSVAQEIVDESPQVHATEVHKELTIDGLREKYDLLWRKYTGANPIFDKGYSACITVSQRDILIVGFNPSDGKIPGSFLYPLPDEKKGYWKDVNNMLVSSTMNLRSNTAYIDLFAFKESDQNTGIKKIIQNPQLFSYVVEQIALTQDLIENTIQPKVIVVKNKGAWAFLGKEPQFTWMGYNFEHVTNTPHGELCKIRGFRKEKDRINSSFTKSNIDGAYVLFTTHTAVDTYPTPEYLQELLNM